MPPSRSICYNSLENPIGIETGTVMSGSSGSGAMLQLIRKPDRD